MFQTYRFSLFLLMVFTDAHSSPSLLFVFVFEVYFWSVFTLLICRCLSQRSSSSLCFPLSHFTCLHLVFQTKLFSSLLCLVPTCWFCFPSPSLQSGDTGGSGPPHCAFDHSCDLQQTCACLREEGKHVCGKSVSTVKEWRSGVAHPPAGLIKTPGSPP